MKTDTHDDVGTEGGRLPFISGVDIDGRTASINWSNTKFVDAWMADRYPNGILQSNSLLIKVKGPHQLATFVEQPKCTALVSGTCVMSGVRDCDPFYLVAYLTSSYAESWRARLRQNITVEFTPYEELASIPVVYPHEKIQKAIGNKIRKADLLRETSEAIRQRIRKTLDAIVPPHDVVLEHASWTSTDLLHHRLDPQPYAQHFLSLERAIRKLPHSEVGAVSTLRGGAPVPSDLFGKDGIGLVRIRDIDDYCFRPPEVYVTQSYCNDHCESLAFKGLVVVGMDGEFRVQFFLTEELPRLINQRIAMITAQGIRPELLTEWLCRSEGQLQLLRWSVKTTVEHISLDDIRQILIPRMDSHLENEIADQIAKTRQHGLESCKLIAEARSDIEALVAGTLDETHLLEENEETARWFETNPQAPSSKGIYND